jgi:crotonobetainyl-CoA:carnitine CoA-transferase CaiB-like acyl-CoA transferase
MDSLPLQGVRIVDLTHAWSGPHCTRILADFGAEVIVVEYPRRLGLFRGGRTEDQSYNRQPVWHQINRNKCSVTLDLNRGEDRAVFMDLVGVADVIVENGRTGVMDRLSLAYQDLVAVKPDLIMLSMPAYGGTGPYASYPAYGAAIEVMSGIQNLTGYGPDDAPQRFREMDVVNGVGGACAVMTALLHRQRTGEGQHIDFSQMELPTHALIGEHLLEFVMNGVHAPPLGNRHRWFAPQGCYRCKGDDRWITITVRSEEDWKRFCEALGHPEWTTDARFANRSARAENHDELDRLIEEWTLERTNYAAMDVLQKHGIAAGAVLDVADISADPHLQARHYFETGVHGSERPFMGVPFKLSRAPGSVRRRGPDLGEHNEYVVCERLGRSKDDVRAVKEGDLGTAYDPD